MEGTNQGRPDYGPPHNDGLLPGVSGQAVEGSLHLPEASPGQVDDKVLLDLIDFCEWLDGQRLTLKTVQAGRSWEEIAKEYLQSRGS